MSDDAVGTSSPAIGWLREALARVAEEILLFGRTFAAFAFSPASSAQDWQSGERTLMNPLGFAATAAGVYWALVSFSAALWPIPGADAANGVAGQLTSAVGPYVHYGVLGAAMHFGLRLLGSKRPFVASLGIALFAAGSAGLGPALVVTAASRWVGHRRGTGTLELGAGDPLPLILLVVAAASYVWVCVCMARGMAGLQRVAAWKGLVAAALAMIVTALLFGTALPQGGYGWHPYIRVDPHDATAFSLGFRG